MFKFWEKLRNLKKRWILAVGLPLAALLIYFSWAVATVNPAELKLAELKYSWDRELICHEDCSDRRRAAENIIISAIRRDPDSPAARRLQDYFLDQNTTEEFKSELILILRTAVGETVAPGYLAAYLKDSGANPTLQAAIIEAFSPTALGFPPAAEPGGGSGGLDYYFDILSGAGDWRLKMAAVRVISNYPDQSAVLNVSQLNVIKKIIFTRETERHWRQQLVLLLADYQKLFPGPTEEILVEVYNTDITDINDDAVSRVFAADILNRRGAGQLALPIVSPEQWEEYYNN